MHRIALCALTLTVVLSLPADAQPFANPPTPAQEPTRELLPATGQTIAGPSGIRNVPDGQSRTLLGFDFAISSTQIEGACVTLLNNGNGAISLHLSGAVGSSTIISKGATQALCMQRLYFARVECQGPGTCTFEWRIDRAAVSND